MTADSRYALFVNGREVSRGPIRSQPRRTYYDLVDLAPCLRPGQNTIAVYVKYYGSPKSYWMPAPANIMLGRTGVFVFEANLGDAGWLVSDTTWKAKKSDAWLSMGESTSQVGGGVPVEVFDARLFAPGWQQPEFDDGTWGAAQAIPAMHIGGYMRTQPPGDPYGPLFPRPIAPLGGELRLPASARVESLPVLPEAPTHNPVHNLELTHDQPINSTQPASLPAVVDVSASATTRIVIDMGRIVSGCVQFEVDAPVGTTFDFSYKEEPSVAPAGFIGQHSGTRYIARGEKDRFEVFDSNGFRYAYVLIGGATGSVTLKHFAVQEMVYPWQSGASFECSDAEINALYTAGVRTVQLNSHDAFIDCPTREQRAWVGDSVVHQMVHLATNTDWRLAWHYLTLGNSPRPDGILPMSVVGEIEASGGVTIPDWSLHWVHGVFNLYQFTGNKDAVKAFMPTIERVLRWYLPYQTELGLLKDVVEWNLIDWASISNEDTSAVITASWARGLREFAEMAAWLEERSSQRWAEGLHAKIKAGFEVFWDEERGSYIDHMKNGKPQPEMSQLAGALAISADLAPRERWPRIIESITDAANSSPLPGAARWL
ncbi:MAG: family 78 glycoside hydrolase catalytic domain, partial [Anaerolineae bacterium]|nr:family 78 glycoside hydrolase catalytic domain [Anaerolineae bacterium]